MMTPYMRYLNRIGMAEGGDVSGDDLSKKLKGQMDTDTLGDGKTIDAVKIGDQDLTGTDVSFTPLSDAKTVDAKTADPADVVTAPSAPKEGAYDISATTTADKVGTARAVTLSRDEISPEVTVQAPQGELSEDAKAKAAQTEVAPEQLTSFQLGKLYESIQEGKPLPAWAAANARAATSVMAKRGLGASSMAAAATAQAIMEAGIPIAAADAAEYSKINLANLNARQQAVLQNANAVAAMDMANLDARMKAAVQNAQSFLAIDLQNLNNRQTTETLNYQGMLQAVFTDAAAENAAAQFNAKTQQQVDEFFAELGVQVDNANANRVAAMSQFNTDQVNSIAQFNASLEDARERFNSTMSAQIDQSNATWRRTIATQDTATQNEVNRQNVMNLLSVGQSALSALWQRYRDESAWLMQSTESAYGRAHQLAMLEFEKNANIDMFGLESDYATSAAVGNAAITAVLGMLFPNANKGDN